MPRTDVAMPFDQADILLRVQGVSKAYAVDEKPSARLRSLLPQRLQGKPKLFWALRDVSFELKRGESLGIVGPNGSGKSTLLQIAAGILRPTLGSVELNGRLAGLLELGSGFNPEFTGRQNVQLSTSLHGLSSKETAARFDEITGFADIGDFLDQPVKTYSSGMLMRLAFSVSIHVDADILLVDEALAVGDIAFRQRCMRRVHQMRDRGLSILFVSHSSEDVKAICDRCLWLEAGQPQILGEADHVVGEYLASMAVRDAASLAGEWESQPDRVPFVAPELAPPLQFSGHRFGDERARITGSAFLSPDGLANSPAGETVFQAEDNVVLRFSFLMDRPVPLPIAGFLVRDAQGVSLFSTNTTREGYLLPPLIRGDHLTVEFLWTMPRLAAGTYGVTMAVSDGTMEEFVVCDYIEDALAFTVPPGNEPDFGWLGLDCEVTINTSQPQA